MKGIDEPHKELSFCDLVELVKCLRYLGDRLNASRGSKAAVIARKNKIKIIHRMWGVASWKKVLLKMKVKINHSSLRWAIFYGRAIWCLRMRWQYLEKMRKQ